MRDFTYFQPNSVDEAVSLLTRYGEQARVIAGGTDLLVDMKHDQVRPQFVISLLSAGLDYMSEETHGLRIGVLTSIRKLEKSEFVRQKYPIISQAASQFGNIPIKNMATIGGNLCNAVPSADMAPALIGLNAEVEIAGPNCTRKVPLEEFFVGVGKTVLKPDEIMTAVRVPQARPNTGEFYLKYVIRSKTDLPVIGIASLITTDASHDTCQDARIVLGNVAPTPIRARQAEEILKGKQINDSLIAESARKSSEAVRARAGSIRASPAYKKAMVEVFTEKAIRRALAQVGRAEMVLKI